MPTSSLHRADLTEREALLFEAGVKLGGVFHQYLGIPVSPRTAPGLARAIADAVSLQPYVASVSVRVRPERGAPLGSGRFAYRYLTPEMLDVRVRLRDGRHEVVARLEHRADLRYPLMSVDRATGLVDRRTPPIRSARRTSRRRERAGRRASSSRE
jgi:dihydroneopterin aldolase